MAKKETKKVEETKIVIETKNIEIQKNEKFPFLVKIIKK